MIRIEQISKKYVTKEALKPTNMKMEAGRVVGLLGPNGSGKTTLLRILANELVPTTGTFFIDEEERGVGLRQHISSYSNASIVPDHYTLDQAAKLYRGFFKDFDVTRFNHLISNMDLKGSMKIKEMSKGMKNKFFLALTVARRAKLILLDEPLDGVDPIAREEVLTLIAHSFDEKSTILVTSHLINELERLLDEVFFIREGQVRYMGSAEELRENKQMSLDEIYRQEYRR